MPLELYRIDDRLIHGQVVVGWGQPLNIGFIVLVDDAVADCDWERDLYRMGIPPEMEVEFASVSQAIAAHSRYAADPRPGILVAGDIPTMQRLVAGIPEIRAVNLGGLHQGQSRTQRHRYVFLTDVEESQLRDIAASGITITAQDVPGARPVPLDEILTS